MLKKRHIITICSIMIMSLTLCVPVSAQGKDINEYMPNAVLVENGVARHITWKEYQDLSSDEVIGNEQLQDTNEKARLTTSENDSRQSRSVSFNWFVPNGQPTDKLITKNKVAVTPIVEGGAGGSSVSYGQSTTVTSTYSVSLTSSEILAVFKSISGSYAKSVMSNESFGITFQVPKNKKCRVFFTPICGVTKGKMQVRRLLEGQTQETVISSKDVEVTCAKKVGKFADGLYALEDAKK